MATPQPKKSVSSVQIGQPSANRPDRALPAAFEPRFQSRRKRHKLRTAPSAASDRNRRSAFSGSPPRLTTSAAKCSSASAVCSFGDEEGNYIGMRLENAANALSQYGANQMFASSAYLAFRFFSRPARQISLYSCISSSSVASQAAIMASSSLAAARMASTSAFRLFF